MNDKAQNPSDPAVATDASVAASRAVASIRDRFWRVLRHPALPLVVFALLAVTSLARKSPTYDEPVLLASGARFLRTGDNGVNAENPPLLKALYALPTLCVPGFRAAPAGIPRDPRFSYDMGAEFAWANAFLRANPRPLALFFVCRLFVVLLAVGLGVVLYRVAAEAWNRAVALWALWGYALSPNILAHARLITPDLGCTAAVFVASVMLYRLLTRGRHRDAVGFGVALGAALLTKFTAILLLPCLILQCLVMLDWRRDLYKWKRLCLNGLLAVVTALVVLNALYGFRGLGSCLRDEEYRSPLVHKLQAVPGLAALPLPVARDYLRGFDIVAYNNRPGLPNIFRGKLYPEGGSWWYYYLAVLAWKMPAPLLVLLLYSVFALVRDPRRRWRPVFFFALVPALFFCNFSVIAYRQLGLRYILPLWPFLLLLSGFGIARLSARWHRRRLKRVALLGIAWYVAGLAQTYPDYLSYFNEFAGGPDYGWQHLAASNTDWGQDLPALRDWFQAHGEPKMGLLYYGSWPPETYGIRSVPWRTMPPPPWLAISVTDYYLYRDVPLIAFLRKHGIPDARAGRSIHIYALDAKLINAFMLWHAAGSP